MPRNLQTMTISNSVHECITKVPLTTQDGLQ